MQNFRIYPTHLGYESCYMARCKDCGEIYYAGQDKKPKANGRYLTRCMTNHKSQNKTNKQIQDSIYFHKGN